MANCQTTALIDLKAVFSAANDKPGRQRIWHMATHIFPATVLQLPAPRQHSSPPYPRIVPFLTRLRNKETVVCRLVLPRGMSFTTIHHQLAVSGLALEANAEAHGVTQCDQFSKPGV